MKQDEFIALADRLDHAANVLQAGSALLQAIARRYYLVNTYAVQGAEKHGVGFRRGSAADEDRRISHQVLPDVILALTRAGTAGRFSAAAQASSGLAGSMIVQPTVTWICSRRIANMPTTGV